MLKELLARVENDDKGAQEELLGNHTLGMDWQDVAIRTGDQDLLEWYRDCVRRSRAHARIREIQDKAEVHLLRYHARGRVATRLWQLAHYLQLLRTVDEPYREKAGIAFGLLFYDGLDELNALILHEYKRLIRKVQKNDAGAFYQLEELLNYIHGRFSDSVLYSLQVERLRVPDKWNEWLVSFVRRPAFSQFRPINVDKQLLRLVADWYVNDDMAGMQYALAAWDAHELHAREIIPPELIAKVAVRVAERIHEHGPHPD